MKSRLRILVLFVLMVAVPRARAAERFILSSNDVVAFVGGGDVAAAQFSGHLESILTRSFPGAKFRNFGWEGDTVFAQPRDFNFPPLTNHLRGAGATVIFVQLGRMEAFAGARERERFPDAYARFITSLLTITPRLVLVTPVRFENPGDPLPNASLRNKELEGIAKHIRESARRHHLPLIDLFTVLGDRDGRISDDGVQISPRGHGIIAKGFAHELGLQSTNLSESAAWTDPRLEQLRQNIISKNRLWFDYWRPQNWAFLGGDRTEQPSSRDHRDMKIRWFPKEMEKFADLIAEKERHIEELSKSQRK